MTNQRRHIVPADAALVIGILARDCGASIEANISRVETLGRCFKDYHVVVYENDSKDSTKAVLQAWSEKNSRVLAIMEDTPVQSAHHTEAVPYPDKSVFRIQRMANCRNRLLDEVRKRYAPDLFCFIDIDIERFSPQSVVTAIERAPDDWGALFANGAIYMQYSDHEQPHFMQYDSFAYVDEGADPLKSKAWMVDKDYHIVTSCRMTWKLRHHDYLPCLSAFNGLGIYRWELIADHDYCVLQTPELAAVNACMCEHVPFNMDIIKKGWRNYLVRDMKVVYWHETPKEKTGLGRWQNYHRACYYFQGRPRLAFKTALHLLKQRLRLFPYQH